MQNLNISIIIPNFNGEVLIKRHLPSIIKASRNVVNQILEIIIVDDGSSDNSVSLLKSEFPEVKVIRHKKNRGFSSAVNTGARSAKGELLALINNDVSVSNNFLEAVIPHFQNDRVFAVSLHEKGYGWAKANFEDGFSVYSPGKESTKPHLSMWVNGGSGVFRRSYWMQLGGMDEKLFSPFYWEDIDLCYRAQKRGWECWWEPNAKVTHEHEATTKKLSKKYKTLIQERNQLVFIWKNITSSRLFRKHLFGLLIRLSRHPGYLRIVFLALGKIRTIVKARQKENKESKVSDEAIFASI